MSLEDDYEKILLKKKKLWAKIEQELKNSSDVYNWQVQVNSAGGGKDGRYLLNGIAITMAIIGISIGWLVSSGDNMSGLWFFGGPSVFMAFFFRFLWMADHLYDYHLTEKGIYYTEQQVIPKIAYSVVRGSAWVGVAVCVVAAALVGPIAFIGAGAFALMSFAMMKFSPVVSTHWVYFQGAYEFAHLKDEGMIELASDFSELSYSGTIHCSLGEKLHILEILQSMIPDSQVSEVTRSRDFHDFVHPSRH